MLDLGKILKRYTPQVNYNLSFFITIFVMVIVKRFNKNSRREEWTTKSLKVKNYNRISKISNLLDCIDVIKDQLNQREEN